MEISYIIDIKKETAKAVSNDIAKEVKLSNNQLV
jgi:hypothetical protein